MKKNVFKICLNIMLAIILVSQGFIFSNTVVHASGGGTLTDTNIKYYGRWDFSDSSVYKNYWGGAYLKVKFTGTTVKINVASDVDLYVNIDGKEAYLNNANGTVNLTPEPLAAGEHSLMIASRYHDDIFEFQGLSIDEGATTLAPDVSDRIIEFAGDSITAGYKLSKQAISDYAWITAERLGYEHTQIAFSGINLEDNWSSSYVPTKIGLSKQFFKTQNAYHENAIDWDFTNYQADMVVVNIGTNDHFMNVPATTFKNTYITYLENIRSKYPLAKILVLRTFGGYMEQPTIEAVNARTNAGDKNIHYIDTTGWLAPSDFPADDYVHPTDSAHVKLADKLAPIIKSHLSGEPSQPDESSITSLNTSVSNSGRVSISGTLSTGAGEMVTVKVVGPNNRIDFIDQTVSTEGGVFEFSYINTTMTNGGYYTVSISTNGESEPTNATFKYIKDSSNNDNSNNDNNNSNDKPKEEKKTGKIEINLSQPEFNSTKGEAKVKVDAKTLDDAFDNVVSDEKGVKMVVLEVPQVKNAKTYSVEFPANELIKGSSSKVVEIKTGMGLVTLPTHIMKGLVPDNVKNINIVIKQADKGNSDPLVANKIGDRPIIDVDIEADGEKVNWENNKVIMIISIPYTASEEELSKREHIFVYYIDEEGHEIPVHNARYDEATGNVIFKTKHLSKYAVAYVTKSFEDIQGYSWVKDEIEVLASREVIKGTSQDTFAPAENIKRADFIVLLHRILELEANVEDNFVDVSPSKYYYEAIGVAKELGITTGIGDNKFDPEASITRQDMMVLTAKALKIAGIELEEAPNDNLNKFKDKTKITQYAVNSVATLVNEEIIVGDSNNIRPLDEITRAETASVIYKVYNKLNE